MPISLAEYNLGYPRLAQVKAQVDETRRRLNEEIRTVVAGIESSFLAAGAKEKELRGKFAEQRSTALQLKDASVEYAILAREVDTNRQLYDSVFQRRKEMGVAADLRTSNIFIVDEAKPPLWTFAAKNDPQSSPGRTPRCHGRRRPGFFLGLPGQNHQQAGGCRTLRSPADPGSLCRISRSVAKKAR